MRTRARKDGRKVGKVRRFSRIGHGFVFALRFRKAKRRSTAVGNIPYFTPPFPRKIPRQKPKAPVSLRKTDAQKLPGT